MFLGNRKSCSEANLVSKGDSEQKMCQSQCVLPPPQKKRLLRLGCFTLMDQLSTTVMNLNMKIGSVRQRKDAFLQFQFVAQKEQTKNSIHAGRVHKDISLNGKLARFKSVAVFFNVQTFQKLVLKWNSQIYKLLSYLVLLWHFSGLQSELSVLIPSHQGLI